jgi:hypothetical protein
VFASPHARQAVRHLDAIGPHAALTHAEHIAAAHVEALLALAETLRPPTGTTPGGTPGGTPADR